MTYSESRTNAVENRLTAVEVRMERLATKEDVEKVKNTIWQAVWLAVSVIVGIAVFVIKYV